MRYLKKFNIICLSLAALCLHSNAQVLENVRENFQQYNDYVLQEKVYVHTDKSFYLTGEILWFKIYNVDAGLNQPLNISKVAYAEVLDDANNPVLQAKIALDNGSGSGSFYIPVTLKNGGYKLRAYTSWMKNFSADTYFEKPISIVNPLNEPAAITKTAKADYAIKFFAESGNLLSGVTSTIGFKATGTDGIGMEINGVVINQRNDTVVRFQSLKFGMGSFTFTPVANDSYKAVVRIGRDNSLINDLPQVLTSGYALHLSTNANNQPQVTVTIKGQGNQQAYLFVHYGHKVVLAQSVNAGADGTATIVIDKDKLGQGINHLTLFNAAGQPVSERLYFKRPDLLTLRANAQNVYKTRNSVDLGITANDAAGKPKMANLSVSVYRLDSLNVVEGGDIASYLWLGSELKGNIESPHYYFDVITAETDKALDNLLLIQGWSRFKWTDVLNAKPIEKYAFLPEIDGHLVTGQATTAEGVAKPEVLAYLGVIGKRVQLYGSRADANGKLVFNTKELYGPGEIVVQTNTEIDSTSRLSIASPFSEQYSTTPLPVFKLSNGAQGQLEANSLNMQVQNIYSSTKLKQYYYPAVDSSAFYANHYKGYKLDEFTRFTTMEEVLREYVAEINVAKSQKRFHIKVISSNGFLQEGDPLVLLDGIPVFNIDKVFTIDPLKVKSLDMINEVYYWGPIFADGILSYTSYKGDMAGTEINPRAVVLDYEGMQLEREFYSPVYKTDTQIKSRLPDFRSVLYWAPNVNTNADGKAGVSFYTSDKPGKYIAVMQGITADGHAGSYSLKFDVNK